jgi:GNAT superfamily N-acetyltransferase
MEIREDDLSGQQTQALLRLHLSGMAHTSPPGHSFALDLTGLRAPGVTVWSVWDGDAICGIGALKQHDAAMGEVKSMRTHPDHLRRGVAALLLEHILSTARAWPVPDQPGDRKRPRVRTGAGTVSPPRLRQRPCLCRLCREPVQPVSPSRFGGHTGAVTDRRVTVSPRSGCACRTLRR